MVVSAYNNGVEEKVKQGNLIKHKGAYEKVVEVDKANSFVSLQTSMECESKPLGYELAPNLIHGSIGIK